MPTVEVAPDLLLALLTRVVGVVVAVLFAYGGFRAILVRAALANRLYRSRALWVGAVGASYSIIVLSNLLIASVAQDNWYLSLLQFFISYLGAALTFAWVDTNILVARRADPLRRNTLYWSKLRLLIWFTLIVGTAGSIAYVVFNHINYFSTASGPQGSFIYGPYTSNAVFSVPVLLLSRRRTGDPTLKHHMRWLIVFIVVLFFVESLLNNPGASVPRFLGSILLGVVALCTYKAARSLSPINRLPPEAALPPPEVSQH